MIWSRWVQVAMWLLSSVGPRLRNLVRGAGRHDFAILPRGGLEIWHWSTDAAIRAVRAAVVVCGLFAITLEGIGNLQIATFAAFGSFATLVLASFGGTRRDKFLAHTALALAGCVLLTIGTAVSGSAALGAIVTVPIAFAVFFAGIAGPNAASAATAVLLGYVLPAASPGTISMVPDRLAGWLLASVLGTAAVLVTTRGPGQDGLRVAASRLAMRLAELLDAALSGAANGDHLESAMQGKVELLAVFNARPYKPIGLAAADEALGSAAELLEWCTSIAATWRANGSICPTPTRPTASCSRRPRRCSETPRRCSRADARRRTSSGSTGPATGACRGS